jgi:hypothetical protein
MPVPSFRVLVFVHRWLGIAGGLLFLAWFASGIVMMYARMPELSAEELTRRAQPLALSAVHYSPAEAAVIAGGQTSAVRLSMFRSRPVWRVGSDRSGRGSQTVFADSGQVLPALDETTAVDVIRELVPEHASSVRYDARLMDADQWTMGVRGQMPLHRVALGDGNDTYFYVAERSGDVVMRTTARERFWAYPGAVLHWLYFAPFRRQAALWTQSIIWLSTAGCVMCVSGLTWGVSVIRRSPYAGLMKWHHYSGLIFGVMSLAWVFSGLLSMGPWGPGSAPSRAQRERVTGGALRVHNVTPDRFANAANALAHATGADKLKQIEMLQFRGELYLRGAARLVSISHPERGAIEQLPHDAVEQAARDAMPGVALEDMTWLQEYDNYYYARDGRLPLPVLRARFADPDRTWLYFDPRRGALVRKEERGSRIERWLYHGFHSLDFPFLYYRRPLWDVVMIALSIGGIVLSATTLLPGWRRLRRHARRWFARAT